MGKKLDINPGEKHKDWLVIQELDRKNGRRYFLCKCLVCNNNYDVRIDNVINENESFCCQACAAAKVAENKVDELIGKVFGRLTVLSINSVNKNRQRLYNCICSCGTTKVINGNNLRSHRTISCGCYKKEIVSKTHSGENHYNWKGGASTQSELDRHKLVEYVNPIIRERDSYTCPNCFQYGCDLNIHHIFDFSTYHELRLEEYNLITLCKTCHTNFHKIYPKTKSNTLQDLEDWMGEEYKYHYELLEKYNEYY